MSLFNSALGRNITFARPAFFIISGFSGIANIKYYFVFLFFAFVFSALANGAVMAVVWADPTLRAPKYVAVFSLALADLLSSTALVPKLLDVFLFGHPRVPYGECLAFLFFCYSCLSMQALNLVALSYDRLVAITRPLHYGVTVTRRSMSALLASFWAASVLLTLLAVGLLTRLSFCGSVVIRSYFCDHGQMFRLACNDNTPSLVLSHLLPALILWLPLGFVAMTYCLIGRALARVATARERLRSVRTCAAHLSLVAVYFLPIMATFAMSARIHPNARIVNLSLASVIPPTLNPLIYVLQTQEIKESLKKMLRRRRNAI